MRLRDIFLFSFNALRDRKLRAALTILGIIVGPAAIVALVGATEGYSQSMSAQFENFGVTTITVMPMRGISLTSHDVEEIQGIPNVQSVIPYYQVNTGLKYGGSSVDSATIMAIDIESLEALFPKITIAEGGAPSQSELTSGVIGFQLANPSDPELTPVKINQVITTSSSSAFQQFGSQGMWGAPSISIRTSTRTQSPRSFLVVGVLNEFGQGLFLNPDDTVFVPLAAGRLLTGSTDYSGLYVVATGPDAVNGVIEEISNIYGDDVRATTVSSILSTVESITGSMQTMLISIASISVVVAFMGIMTTMFTSISERTREIGVIKALGHSGRTVMLFFLTEAVLTGFIGGVIGSLTGAAGSYLVVSTLGGAPLLGGGGPIFGGPGRGQPGGAQAQSPVVTPVITPELMLATILMATCVGALAGIIPAWSASRLTPVEALRHE
jgi:putative ABC transport system permease protein